MKKVVSIGELKKELNAFKNERLKVGLVPTMGYLHKGHLSLIERCKEECDVCVVSVYVNPSQFNDSNDFLCYPKDIDRDLSLLNDAGCDLVWIPNKNSIEEIPLDLIYDVENTDKGLEGKCREGHFKGVIEVVYRLFKTVNPDKAYFGEKDYQQLKVIEAMARVNKLPIKVIGSPTVRETDGLAMSSRNVRLSKKHRELAPNLFRSICRLANKRGDVEFQLRKTKDELQQLGFEVEYLDVYSFASSQERLFAAVKLGDVRLIDNVELR